MGLGKGGMCPGERERGGDLPIGASRSEKPGDSPARPRSPAKRGRAGDWERRLEGDQEPQLNLAEVQARRGGEGPVVVVGRLDCEAPSDRELET